MLFTSISTRRHIGVKSTYHKAIGNTVQDNIMWNVEVDNLNHVLIQLRDTSHFMQERGANQIHFNFGIQRLCLVFCPRESIQ